MLSLETRALLAAFARACRAAGARRTRFRGDFAFDTDPVFIRPP
jgi:hypothetical protein